MLMTDDLLWQHIKELPAFRGLLRAVEARFYVNASPLSDQGLPLPRPALDVGCGDGHFASVLRSAGSPCGGAPVALPWRSRGAPVALPLVGHFIGRPLHRPLELATDATTFDEPLDAGLDPWWGPLSKARARRAYRVLAQADGAHMPYPDGYFASAFSNSVLEHIPDVAAVLAEIARVLRPGAPFYFSVPSEDFLPLLSIGRTLDALRLHPLAKAYRRFFNRISRHHHCDNAGTWQARLERAGLALDGWWPYFSRGALAALEWGHYLGLPALVAKKLTGRWILWPSRANLWLTERLLRRYYEEPLPKVGAYLFFVAHKPAKDESRFILRFTPLPWPGRAREDRLFHES
jgi:SAM-dependent methyltransferase